MSRVQILARDRFGGIVFNQTSPNFPIAALSISIFLDLYEGYVGSIVLLKKGKNGVERNSFKVRRDEHWFYLENSRGGKVLLPEPPSEEDYEDPLDDDEDNGLFDDDDGEMI